VRVLDAERAKDGSAVSTRGRAVPEVEAGGRADR
jgi:hypothetical protein